MQFGISSTEDAEGGILAHSVRAGDMVFRKGRVLSTEDVATLIRAERFEVMVARLEPDDIPEDEAASRIAALLGGGGVRKAASFTGRTNLYATEHGIALIDVNGIDALNAIHESITVATLPPYARVTPRQMLATVKIIPFAAPAQAVREAEQGLSHAPLVNVAPFRKLVAGLISTVLPETRGALLDKNRKALETRLGAVGSELIFECRVPHAEDAIAAAISRACEEGCDPVLVFGASAITDRRDAIPAAIARAGGKIEHFGMPVDPGNLLLLGSVKGRTIIGLPGCARSPKLNGFDFVLWRVAAGLPVGPREIAGMGVGGLLSEIATRPQPRDEAHSAQPHAPRIAALVLAAGMSSRMGSNKLLKPLRGQPMVRHAVEAALASAASPVIVVTGHAGDEIRKTLSDLPVRFVENPDFATGLSSSLKCGLSALPEDSDGVLVLLGDMPGINAGLLDKLIAAFEPEEQRAICVPTRRGRRGNPVLWARRFFPDMMAVEGDVGARSLIGANAELVCEIEAPDDGPLIDIDTPEALAAFSEPAS